MGRDRAKKKAKTSSSSSTRSEEFSDIRLQFATLNAKITSRNELRAMELYMRDISHLHGEELERALVVKAKLKQMWGF